jgi:hypothetical protein
MVPDQNPRVVTVTVEGDSEKQARSIALEIVHELVSLSPAPTGVTQPAFVSAQADALETTIQQTEQEVDELEGTLAQATDPEQRSTIERTIAVKQQFLNDSRQTYVELMSLEPDSDAGGLAVLDDVASVTHAGRVGPTNGALLGAAVGAVLGLLTVWLLDRRHRARSAEPAESAGPAPGPPTVNVVVRPTTGNPNLRLPRVSQRRPEPQRAGPRERVNR